MFKIIKVGEQGGSIKIKWDLIINKHYKTKHYKTKLVPSIRRQKKSYILEKVFVTITQWLNTQQMVQVSWDSRTSEVISPQGDTHKTSLCNLILTRGDAPRMFFCHRVQFSIQLRNHIWFGKLMSCSGRKTLHLSSELCIKITQHVLSLPLQGFWECVASEISHFSILYRKDLSSWEDNKELP